MISLSFNGRTQSMATVSTDIFLTNFAVRSLTFVTKFTILSNLTQINFKSLINYSQHVLTLLFTTLATV